MTSLSIAASATCRSVAEEMATSGNLRMPVVDRETNLIAGSIGAAELLAGRRRAVQRESDRSIAFRVPSPRHAAPERPADHPSHVA